MLKVTQEEKGGIVKEMEVIHKLCWSDLVDLIKNDRQKTECFPSINTTVLGWVSMYSGIHAVGVKRWLVTAAWLHIVSFIH